ncbi:hypothetical protein Aduo_001667 [Ancylostoma duodenale]
MNQLLSELNEVSKSIGLEMNMKKTQMMANQWCDNGIVQLDGITLRRVDSYVYLGREVTTNDLTGEIGRRRKAAWAAMDMIRERTSQIRVSKLRVHLFDSTVPPALCYANGTWTDNRNISMAMRTTHRALERCLLETNRWKQWKCGLSSKDLRKESNYQGPDRLHGIRRASMGRTRDAPN